MTIHGRTSADEFLGHFVVYRNLVPVDPRLPPLPELRPEFGFPENFVPRKNQTEYAQVIVRLLRAAQDLRNPGHPLQRLIYIGDTQLNDGTAFRNISQAGGWPGIAFIGADRTAPPHVDVVRDNQHTLYVANRWRMIEAFDTFCTDEGFPVDETTAVIVDLDKTALGARGRNDHVINAARVEAVRRTVSELLGSNFDPQAFQTAYDALNQEEFHPFTADNQDYLAYVCLVLAGRVLELKPLIAEIRTGRLQSFQQFIAERDDHKDELPGALLPIHEQINRLVMAGDPTPFKAFRYNEYRVTVERMGYLNDESSVTDLLAQEIVITQEVRQKALEWRGKGALLFGLSDKPDEASIPSKTLARDGYLAIHCTETHAVGE